MRRREKGNPGTEDSVLVRTSKGRSRGYAAIQGLAVWAGGPQDFALGSAMAGFQVSGSVRSGLIRPNPTKKRISSVIWMGGWVEMASRGKLRNGERLRSIKPN